ncbi:hypothetical protein MTY59_23350 [Mycobacterium senriense]|uniref:Uncharacterized protein n=1 Tax=Mycobacterium senriense TaxID=2775496 RepID=A0ABM7SRB6_9MYCO|nr:hypothetical protein MTY59_23350 [Mycobacterium senriense]
MAPTVTICPDAASTPERSATAGGTDSAVKKESWLTPPTVGQGAHPRLEVIGAASRANGDAHLVAAVDEETPRPDPLGGSARGASVQVCSV